MPITTESIYRPFKLQLVPMLKEVSFKTNNKNPKTYVK